MKTTKLVLVGVAAVLGALLAGWLLGASAKRPAERALQTATLQNDLLASRGSVLAARVDLYNINFGEASRHLEEARGRLRPAAAQLKGLGRPDDVARIDRALSLIEEAQRMAGKLDQGANSRAADALKAIDEVRQIDDRR